MIETFLKNLDSARDELSQTKRALLLLVGAMFFLFFSTVMLAHFSGITELQRLRVVNPIAGIVPLLGSLLLPYIALKRPDFSSRGLLALTLILTMFGNVGVYQNGVMTYALGSAFLLFLTLTVSPVRYRWSIGIGAVLLPILMINLSSIESDPAVTQRIALTLGSLIWPINTLLDPKIPLEARRWLAAKRLVLGGGMLWSLVQVVFPIHGSMISQHGLISLMLYLAIRKIEEPSRYLLLVLSIAPLVMFVRNMEAVGDYATYTMQLWILLTFLLLPLRVAIFIAAIYLLIASVSLDLLDTRVLRSLFSSLIFTGMLGVVISTLFKRQQPNSSASSIKLYLTHRLWSVGFAALVLGVSNVPLYVLGLEMPEGETLYRWILVELILFVLTTAAAWIYLEESQNRDRERDLMRRETESVNQELQRTLQRQKEIFSVIGHELRTPVASIKMLMDDEDLTQDERNRFLTSTATSLLNIIDDMRIVVAPERIKRAGLDDFKPNAVITEALASVKGVLSGAGFKVQHRLAEEGALTVRFSGQALRQLVMNLVKNAALHSGGNEVRISLTAEQTDTISVDAQPGKNRINYRLVVEDNGQGIEPEDREALFEAFKRGNSTCEGTGLGLAITRELAITMGGSITCTDSEMGGAAFVLLFSAETASKKSSTETVTADFTGIRVLLAEDDAVLRMLSQKMLTKAGAVVELANDGQQALERYRQSDKAFDIVVTDIMMPNLDGVGLTQTLRSEGYSGLVVGVSAAVIGEETQQLLDAGANYCLAKPLSLDALQRLRINLSQNRDNNPDGFRQEITLLRRIQTSETACSRL